jgi:hypothetical protein
MWRVGEVMFFDQNRRVEPAGPQHFNSAWKPAGTGEEWVYVDLGAVCTFDRIALAWIRRAAEGAIQVSDDAATWRTLRPPTASDDIRLTPAAKARYVHVLMNKPASAEGYVLSELAEDGRRRVQRQVGAGARRLERCKMRSSSSTTCMPSST